MICKILYDIKRSSLWRPRHAPLVQRFSVSATLVEHTEHVHSPQHLSFCSVEITRLGSARFLPSAVAGRDPRLPWPRRVVMLGGGTFSPASESRSRPVGALAKDILKRALKAGCAPTTRYYRVAPRSGGLAMRHTTYPAGVNGARPLFLGNERNAT